MKSICCSLIFVAFTSVNAFGQNQSPRPGLAGEQGVGNPPSTSSLPNSSANSPNASPQVNSPASVPNSVPANSLQNQPNSTASEATPNGTGPGPSQRQIGPRQGGRAQYGSNRMNYGSGLMPNQNQGNSQQQRQRGGANQLNQMNPDPVGRTMFPPSQRFNPAPGTFGNNGDVNSGAQVTGNNQNGYANNQNGNSSAPNGTSNNPTGNLNFPNGHANNQAGNFNARNGNSNNQVGNVNGQMNQNDTQINSGLNSNTPRQPMPTDAHGWRFANHNGNWWYWMPGEYRAAWDGNAWHRYTPAGPATVEAESPQAGTTAVPTVLPYFQRARTEASANTSGSNIPNFQ